MTTIGDIVRDELRVTRACVADAITAESASLRASRDLVGESVREYFLATRQRQELARAGCIAYAKNLGTAMRMSNGALVMAPVLLTYRPSVSTAILATVVVGGYEYLRQSARHEPRH